MRKSRFSEEQIIGLLKQAEAGRPVAELCRGVAPVSTGHDVLQVAQQVCGP